MIDELADAGCDLLVIDKDREAVDAYKDRVSACYVADAISEEVVTRLVPPGLDAAILDLGSSIEAAILATKYLKKLGVARIVAKVESDQHAEILELVGATDIIRANLEAARRVAPLLLSSMLFSYLPIGKDFVIAEVKVPEEYVGRSLIEANLRAAAPPERHRPAGGAGNRLHLLRPRLPAADRRRSCSWRRRRKTSSRFPVKVLSGRPAYPACSAVCSRGSGGPETGSRLLG